MATTSVEEKTNFTFKMDKTTRDQFDKLCDTIGISMSAAINALVKQAVREQRMSFSAVDENGFTPEESQELLRRIADIRKGEMQQHNLIEG